MDQDELHVDAQAASPRRPNSVADTRKRTAWSKMRITRRHRPMSDTTSTRNAERWLSLPLPPTRAVLLVVPELLGVAGCRLASFILGLAVLLVAGCGGPDAWNQYTDPTYPEGGKTIAPVSSLPAEISGSIDGVPPEALRVVVAEGIGVPTATAVSGTIIGSGSSVPPTTASHTVWTFSQGASATGKGTPVHVEARYYDGTKLLTVAEGDATVAGANDPALRLLVADVASALVPTLVHSHAGRG